MNKQMTSRVRLSAEQVKQAVLDYAKRHYKVVSGHLVRESKNNSQYDPDYEIVAYIDVAVEPLKTEERTI